MFKYIRNISAKNQTIIPFDFLFCVFLNIIGEKKLIQYDSVKIILLYEL